MGTCRQCGSWSVAGHNRKKLIGRGPIYANLLDMDFDPSKNGSTETMYDEGDQNLVMCCYFRSINQEYLSTRQTFFIYRLTAISAVYFNAIVTTLGQIR